MRRWVIGIGLAMLSLGGGALAQIPQPIPQPLGAPTADEPLVPLQIVGAEVETVLSNYEALAGVTLVRDANLETVSLTIVSKPIPRSEAVRLIEATLLLNGITLVPLSEKIFKVINSGGGKNPRSAGVPIYTDLEDLPAMETVVSYFMPLRFISHEEALAIFQQQIQLNPYGSMVSVPNAGALVVTENVSVIRQLARLKELIDVPPAETISRFVQLERADAERVAEAIRSILEARRQTTTAGSAQPQAPQQAGRGNQRPQPPPSPAVNLQSNDLLVGKVQLQADARTNRILVVTRPVNFDYIVNLIREFDRALDVEQPVELPLNYVPANEILPVLGQMLLEAGQSPAQVGTPGGTRPSTGRPATGTQTRGSLSRDDLLADPLADTAPEALVVGKVRLIADKQANSILVLGPPESVSRVREVVKVLDRRPKQVYLATVIGQLTLGKGSETGFDLLQKFSTGGDAGIAGSSRNRRNASGVFEPVPDPASLVTSAAFPQASGLFLAGKLGSTLDLYVKALESSNRFKILSRPSIFTTNNRRAKILSGQRVAIPTQTQTNVNNNDNFLTNIEFEDVVLQLEVIPLINDNNEVQMEIVQVNDTVLGTQTVGNTTVPSIGRQEVKSTITVRNGETVVLGGLITDSDERTQEGIPWISRVPLIGELFKQTRRSKERAELLVLIQPIVVETEEDIARAHGEHLRRMEIGPDADAMMNEKDLYRTQVDQRPALKARRVEGEAEEPAFEAGDTQNSPSGRPRDVWRSR